MTQAGAKIIAALQEAIDGNLARVTIGGVTWAPVPKLEKRPVAFRVKDPAFGAYFIWENEKLANEHSERVKEPVQGLYVREDT